jgi:hypothetical protein
MDASGMVTAVRMGYGAQNQIAATGTIRLLQIKTEIRVLLAYCLTMAGKFSSSGNAS